MSSLNSLGVPLRVDGSLSGNWIVSLSSLGVNVLFLLSCTDEAVVAFMVAPERTGVSSLSVIVKNIEAGVYPLKLVSVLLNAENLIEIF